MAGGDRGVALRAKPGGFGAVPLGVAPESPRPAREASLVVVAARTSQPRGGRSQSLQHYVSGQHLGP